MSRDTDRETGGTAWVYASFEPGLWTVGFYNPDGHFIAESDHRSAEGAAWQVNYLNGGSAVTEAFGPPPATAGDVHANRGTGWEDQLSSKCDEVLLNFMPSGLLLALLEALECGAKSKPLLDLVLAKFGIDTPIYRAACLLVEMWITEKWTNLSHEAREANSTTEEAQP